MQFSYLGCVSWPKFKRVDLAFIFSVPVRGVTCLVSLLIRRLCLLIISDVWSVPTAAA